MVSIGRSWMSMGLLILLISKCAPFVVLKFWKKGFQWEKGRSFGLMMEVVAPISKKSNHREGFVIWGYADLDFGSRNKLTMVWRWGGKNIKNVVNAKSFKMLIWAWWIYLTVRCWDLYYKKSIWSLFIHEGKDKLCIWEIWINILEQILEEFLFLFLLGQSFAKWPDLLQT